MDKPFLSIDQQVRLLERRGVRTDGDTPTILLREGYYAVINGYGKPFLDAAATQAADDDRYREGTTFNQIYQLFLFDRSLRATTFRAIMCVEGTLRSILSHSFCERHRAPDAYLDRDSYAPMREYLRPHEGYAGDLEWMLNTLRHHANGHVVRDTGEMPDPDDGANARVEWYRERYDAVPLWVLFSDLTFGNLRYFYALMHRGEQKAVCRRLAQTCGTTSDGDALSPRELLHDMEALSDLRNDCAHVERIYDGRYGADELSYLQVLDVLAAFLAQDDEERLYASVATLVRRHADASPAVADVLADAGFARPH
jgi:abortive infection bacteriophage resistance protein